jgi:superoxide dismutase, Fe-Mn family
MNTIPLKMTLKRRSFLRFGLGAAVAPIFVKLQPLLQAQQARRGLVPLPRTDGAYELPELPYAANALEPHIDARTMEIHHGRHHAAYINNLNGALENQPDLKERPLWQIMRDLESVPAAIRTTVRNNGGGHFNHALFWSLMKPAEGGGRPPQALGEAIQQAFGGMDGMMQKFNAAAMGRFGSGWAWLIRKEDGQLAVTSTPNQDNPLMRGVVEETGFPILGLDVWEHAYYLKYQNRRADYVQAWWNVVNWDKANELFEARRR